MKSKSQLIQESLLAELEKVNEIDFFKKAGKAVAGVATGLDKLSKFGKTVANYDPSKPSATNSKAVDPYAAHAAKQKEIDDAVRKSKAKPNRTGGKVAGKVSQTPNAIRKRAARDAKKSSSIATGISQAKVTPTAVPGAKKKTKLPSIGGILPTDPRYPALAAKIAAADKNK